MRPAPLRRVVVVLLAACLAIGFTVSASPQTRSARASVFGPRAHPFGLTYPEWLGEYSEWLQEIPAEQNPLFKPASPANCALQGGVVVFMGPHGGHRRIPRGAAVAISPFGWECSTAEGLDDSWAELRRCAVRNWARDFGPQVFPLTARLDGRRLRGARRWTFISPGEIVMFPEDNIWGASPGPSRSVIKGLFYILRPLHRGTHTLRVRGRHELFGPIDIIYRLTVGKAAAAHISTPHGLNKDHSGPAWGKSARSD